MINAASSSVNCRPHELRLSPKIIVILSKDVCECEVKNPRMITVMADDEAIVFKFISITSRLNYNPSYGINTTFGRQLPWLLSTISCRHLL
ncbi:hypothetical protein RJT34_31484 [Clitoria ternatea]|uniref:Uncharacterized protein n=1 Tax=Clitoria ternatea TaxID=43366 RepID=A0AAN9EWE6_CLITE